MFLDVVASAYSVLALDTVGRLDRELATLAAYVDDVRDLLCRDARGSLVVQAVARVIVNAQHLRSQAHDAAAGVDADSIEIRERALRARMNIIVRALYALKQNERWMPQEAFGGRFRSLREFNLHVVDYVAQVHACWLEQRDPEQPADRVAQRTIIYAALDDAEIAFERLGRDDAVQQFLSVGASSACEAIATACRELATTVGAALRAATGEAAGRHPAKSLAGRSAS